MQGLRIAGNIELTFKREDVLTKLRENLIRHRKIVEESQIGYLVKAKEVLERRIAQIDAGQQVALEFTLRRPVSHVEIYEATISMFEHAMNETVDLSMEQQQAFMCDRWDWQNSFLVLNSDYSATAAGML